MSLNEFSSVAILEMISFLLNELKFQFMLETILRKPQVVAFTFNAFLLGHTFLGTCKILVCIVSYWCHLTLPGINFFFSKSLPVETPCT